MLTKKLEQTTNKISMCADYETNLNIGLLPATLRIFLYFVARKTAMRPNRSSSHAATHLIEIDAVK